MKVVEFIYTDEIQLDDVESAISILIEANKFNLTRLKSICESYLSQIIDQENVNQLLHLADIHEASEL